MSVFESVLLAAVLSAVACGGVPGEPEADDSRLLSDRLLEARDVVMRAEADQAMLVARMAHTYRDRPAPTGLSSDDLLLADVVRESAVDGVPPVAEFLPLELAALLGMSTRSATGLVLDVMALQYRHRRLWARVCAGEVPVWVARKIASAAADLTARQADQVDAVVAPVATRLSPGRLFKLVTGLVADARNIDLKAVAEEAKRQRMVQVFHARCQADGVSEIFARTDSSDAVYFDAMVARIADILAENGDTASLDERRAKAVGIMATPARALAMLQHAIQPDLDFGDPAEPDAPSPDSGLASNQLTADASAADAPVENAAVDAAAGDASAAGQPADASVEDQPADASVEDQPADAAAAGQPADALCGDGFAGHGARSPWGCAGHVCGTVTVDPEKLLPKALLYVHVAAETLIAAAAGEPADSIARVENVGPAILQVVQGWLGHTNVQVCPVIDTRQEYAVDGYEIPARLREAVKLREPHEVFPFSSRSSRRLELDHTIPWRKNGPSGQTRASNLGPLTRTVHRAKTHANWKLEQPKPGTYLWTTPLGHQYQIDNHGTQRIE